MIAANRTSLTQPPAWHGVHCSEFAAEPFAASLPTAAAISRTATAPAISWLHRRCGAHTRCGGSCRQPAMPNGRCRLHGGLSTGPRTPDGLARSRRARWKHGARSAEVRALLREACRQSRRTRALRARVAGSSAGHGVHRSNSNSLVGARCARAVFFDPRIIIDGVARERPAGAAQRAPTRVNLTVARSPLGMGSIVRFRDQTPSALHRRSPAVAKPASARAGALRPNLLLPLGMGSIARFAIACAHRPRSAPSAMC